MKVDALGRRWLDALTAAPVHEPPRILDAEDDGEMRRLVTDALRKDGYDVVSVSDGGRLLDTLTQESKVDKPRGDVFDLLVSDVRMPLCGGMQILEQLRSAHWTIPVILMTAFGDAASREKARALGALLFDKPFGMEDLRSAVAYLLQRERDGRGPDAKP